MTERRDQRKSNTSRTGRSTGTKNKSTGRDSAEAERKTEPSASGAEKPSTSEEGGKASRQGAAAAASTSAVTERTASSPAREPASTPPPRPGGSSGGADGDGHGHGHGHAGGGGRGLAIAALVIAIVVAVVLLIAGWLGWQRLYALDQQRPELVTESALSRATDDLNQRLDAMRSQSDDRAEAVGGVREALRTVQGAQQEMRGQVAKIGELEAVLADVRESVRQLEKTQQQMSSRMEELGKSRADQWKRSEAAYLGGVAMHRLRYYGDLSGALAALREAKRLLEQFGGDAGAARQGVNQAIDQLAQANPPNPGAIAEQLTKLEQKVSGLPLSPEPPQLIDTGEGEPAQAEGDNWRAVVNNAWGQVKSGLSELVVVTRDADVQPLRSPEQRFFIEQNLRLKLETARAAALRGEQRIYDNALAQVQQWLEKYLDGSNAAVADMTQAVKSLRSKRIGMKLPDIQSQLDALRQYE